MNLVFFSDFFVGAFMDAIGGELCSSPLHWATRQGHLSMVVLLVQHGADPNICDGEGKKTNFGFQLIRLQMSLELNY
jgi:hypothetical protein